MGGALGCQSQNPDLDIPPAPVEPKVTTPPSKSKAITHRFLVTGFGPFGNLKTNPAASLVHWLEAQSSSGNSTEESSVTSQSNPSATWQPLDLADLLTPAQQRKAQCRPHVQLMCEVLKVSVTAVDGFFARLDEQQAASAEGDTGVVEETVTLLLHLGEEEPAPGFKLENTAYNSMTSRIPDGAGHNPHSIPINPRLPLDAPLHTSIDLIQLEMRLADAGYCNELCSVCHDPGRSVCNYTFYRSLEATQTRGPSSNSKVVAGSRIVGDNSEGGDYHSLFVHVPPFEAVTEARQRQFLAALISALTEQLTMHSS